MIWTTETDKFCHGFNWWHGADEDKNGGKNKLRKTCFKTQRRKEEDEKKIDQNLFAPDRRKLFPRSSASVCD